MENLTGGTPPVRYLPCVVPCKLYFEGLQKLADGISEDESKSLDGFLLVYEYAKGMLEKVSGMENVKVLNCPGELKRVEKIDGGHDLK